MVPGGFSNDIEHGQNTRLRFISQGWGVLRASRAGTRGTSQSPGTTSCFFPSYIRTLLQTCKVRRLASPSKLAVENFDRGSKCDQVEQFQQIAVAHSKATDRSRLAQFD